jgi:hypothetical protein
MKDTGSEGVGTADHDDSIDQQIEDISENLYLSAYFHCDKGNGVIVEDITEYNNECVISYTNPGMLNESASEGGIDDLLWTHVLEEFEPLEYEDKWGRKNPASHAIRLSSKPLT